MARRVGFVARSETSGSAVHVNTAEDLCTEYVVEGSEIHCPRAALSVDTVVTFEVTGNRRATCLRLLAEEDDLDTIQAAITSPVAGVRQAVPLAKAALVQRQAPTVAESRPSPEAGQLSKREPPSIVTRDGVANPSVPGTFPRPLTAQVPTPISPRRKPPSKLPTSVRESPKVQSAVANSFDVASSIPVARATSVTDCTGTASNGRIQKSLPTPTPDAGLVEMRHRESWVWQITTPPGMIGANVGTSASPTPPAVLPFAIANFFAEHVAKPFSEHSITPGWGEEVTSKTDVHHRRRVVCQGVTNFDAPHFSLPAADKVLVYCYYYLQMHAATTLYVYDQAMYYCGLGLAPHTVFVDFGCGPLTLPLSLVWLQHLRLFQEEPPPRLRLHYVGVEHSERMTERGKHFLEHSGLFQPGPTFRFSRSCQLASSLCHEINALQPSSDRVKSDIVLNMSYFISSDSVVVQDLATTVQTILRAYQSHRVWLVFQNPIGFSREKWERFKQRCSEFRLVSSGEENIGYTNSTNLKRTGNAKLCHEVLVRDPVGSDVSSSDDEIPF
jgi:hypothetical protein